MKEVYLIRHTTPLIKAGLCYGSSDIDVEDSFVEEAEGIKTVLKEFYPDVVVSSPLIRCMKLANHLFFYV